MAHTSVEMTEIVNYWVGKYQRQYVTGIQSIGIGSKRVFKSGLGSSQSAYSLRYAKTKAI